MPGIEPFLSASLLVERVIGNALLEVQKDTEHRFGRTLPIAADFPKVLVVRSR